LKGGGRRTNLTRLYRRNLSGFLDAFKAILPRIQREATVRGRGSNAPGNLLAMAVPQMTAGLNGGAKNFVCRWRKLANVGPLRR
jgi:hypothetical protein